MRLPMAELTHQQALTIYAPIRPEALDGLRETLAKIAEDVAGNDLLPFGRFGRLHFARLLILDEARPVGPDQLRDLDNSPIPAHLAFLCNVDAPLEAFVDQLAEEAANGLDAIFEHCEAYPQPNLRTPQSRRDFLLNHQIPEAAFYVNTIGRPVAQIHQEAQLREELEKFLDSNDWADQSALEVRRKLIEFVRSRPDLEWAANPAKQAPLRWQSREKLHFIFFGLLGLVLGLLFLPVILIALLMLRNREKTDPVENIRPPTERLTYLRSFEDHWAHNQFSATGYIKPGWLRLITLQVALAAVNFGVRHLFNKGNLTGVKTIHFARWIFIDDKKRMLFCSNYDGSLESYMVDFIDIVWWGLNLVFTNGYGYPRTRWVIFEGARDELAFKNYIRNHQLQTQVWYSAYPQLTAVNINNNLAIRAGLAAAMNEEEAAAWLQRL